MKKGTRKGLSEGRLAWSSGDSCTAFHPCDRHFSGVPFLWLSLHDVRLNDATKRTTHSHYGVDLEGYANSMPFLLSALDQEIKKAEGATQKRLTQVKAKVEDVRSTLEKNSRSRKTFKEWMSSYLRGRQFRKPEAGEYRGEESSYLRESDLTDPGGSEGNGTEGVLNHPKRVTGLAKGLQECLIEPNFVGLKYYRIYLTDERMWASLTNTLVFTGISVGVELVLGIAIALLINRRLSVGGWCGPRC